MREERNGDEERLKRKRLVVRPCEEKIWLAGWYGACNERDERGVCNMEG